jgi:hypothetical protein
MFSCCGQLDFDLHFPWTGPHPTSPLCINRKVYFYIY